MRVQNFKTIAMGACAAVTLATQIAQAADHRDAYEISLRPSANLADVFIFGSPQDADNVVIGLTVSGHGVADSNPSYAFEHAITYQLAVDTYGDLGFDHTLDVVFDKPAANADGTYAQAYTVTLNGTVLLTATSTPASVRAIDPVLGQSSDIQIFAGATDDPFFGDVAGFYLKDFPGRDGFAGMNTLSIMIELPFEMICGGAPSIAMSGFTYDADGTQLDRMAMPLVNAAIIPSEMRDTFNTSRPKDDVAMFGEVLGELAPDVLRFEHGATTSFPNGRHPADDVVGLLLQLDDNVDANDVPFTTTFPYLAAPHVPD